LSDLAADIAQNSAESGAALIELAISELNGEFRFYAGDNGKGMAQAVLDRALDPFVTDGVKHPGRKVGLGLPFLIQTAEASGGGWRISSSARDGGLALRSGGTGNAFRGSTHGCGTGVEAWFDLANVDTPPVGDIPGLFRTVLLFSGPAEMVLKRSRKGATGKTDLDYSVKKSELTEALGGDLEDVSSLVLLGKYLRSLEGEAETD